MFIPSICIVYVVYLIIVYYIRVYVFVCTYMYVSVIYFPANVFLFYYFIVCTLLSAGFVCNI